MGTKQGDLTHARVRELLDYDRQTGVFHWLVSRGRSRAGSVAGARSHHGYVVISVDGRQYYAHRLTCFWITGEWPVDEVDHEDTKTSSNTWQNLRPATHAENMRNRGTPRNNTSGFKGVIRVGKKFRAQIKVCRVHRHLGIFQTAELAHTAYCAAAKRLHGEFARGA